MSYDLGVFFTEKPHTDTAAVDRYTAYCEAEDLTPFIEPSPRVADFLKELTKEFPEPQDVPDAEMRRCPWSGSFDVSSGHVVMSIGWYWVGEMTDIITNLAAKHGLVCVDPQANRILTAPSEVFIEERRRLLRKSPETAGQEPYRAQKTASAVKTKKSPSLEEIVSKLSGPLAALGFTHHADETFIREMNEEIVAHIILTERERLQDSEIKPQLGFGHRSLARLIDELQEVEPHSVPPPVLRTSLWLVMPRKGNTSFGRGGAWEFSDIQDLERQVPDIVAAIEKHALPAFQDYTTLEQMVADIVASRRCWTSESDYEPVAGLYLLGRIEEALSYLEARLVEHTGTDHPYIRAYRSFAGRMIEHIEKSDRTVSPDRLSALKPLVAKSAGAKSLPMEAWPEWPLVLFLDELLGRHGFQRTDLTWQKNSSHAVIALTLQTGLGTNLWLQIWFRVSREVDLSSLEASSDVLATLGDLLPKAAAYKMLRALRFHYDQAISRKGAGSDDLTDSVRREIIRAMEPEKPLTLEWRRAALGNVMESEVLPQLEKLETSRLARFRLRLRVYWYGFSLGTIPC